MAETHAPQELEYEKRFIAWLEKLKPDSGKAGDAKTADRRALAELRKSLAFELGTYYPIYAYVEAWVPGQDRDGGWARQMHYLVAGLYAVVRPDSPKGVSFGRAARLLKQKRDSGSIERRFLTLLAAEEANELAYHLRQLTSLMRTEGIAIDFALLLSDLKRWRSARGYVSRGASRRPPVQQRWAREFYAPGTDEDGSAHERPEDDQESEREDQE